MTHPLIFLSWCEALATTTIVLSFLDLTSVTSASGLEINLTLINNISFSHRTNSDNKNKLQFQDRFKGLTLSLSFLFYIYFIFLRQKQFFFIYPYSTSKSYISLQCNFSDYILLPAWYSPGGHNYCYLPFAWVNFLLQNTIIKETNLEDIFEFIIGVIKVYHYQLREA